MEFHIKAKAGTDEEVRKLDGTVVEIGTIDDLREIYDKVGYELIIDFETSSILIYDAYIE